MFQGWDEHPPTNLLVKAIVEGLGGGSRKGRVDELIDIPSHAQDAMQRAAVSAIAAKADPRFLPVIRGRDIGLPKTTPIFDLDELRQRNAETIKNRVKKGSGGA